MPPPLPGTAASLWLHESPVTTYPQLDGDLSVDVAIVGGGIVGLTAATLLKRAGATVAVIEAGRVARGVSGHTTAKVTSLHGLRYSGLASSWSEEAARAYAESNQAGVEGIAQLVEEEADRLRLRARARLRLRRDLGASQAPSSARPMRRASPASTPRSCARSTCPFPCRRR
ncbi:MAG: FAD-binding oxidoreductase [Thermoleophilaceae bacterium]